MRTKVACLLAAAISLGTWQAASAADLPLKAPIMPAPFSWTGCYIGANAGAAWSHTDFTSTMDTGTHLGLPANLATVGNAGTGSAKETGFIGGGQVGCNWQTGAIVFGVEGDFNAFTPETTLSGSGVLTTGDTFAIDNSVKARWLATVRPRIGYAFDRSLIYVTGGLAVANLRYTQTYSDTLFSGFGTSETTSTKAGWTVGGGWEYAFDNHWSAKLEYLYASFPSIDTVTNVSSTTGGTNTLHGSAEVHSHIVRVGLNYRFGSLF